MTAVLVVSVLSGCGSGSEGGVGVSDDGVDAPGVELTDRTAERGRLIDSPVSGIHYLTASQFGTTDEEGGFAYRIGETVSFHLGDPAEGAGPSFRLGETLARDVVTPLELANSEFIDDRVVNLLRLIQTLDDDLDPSNGIRIVHDGLPDGMPELDLSLPSERFATDPAVLHLIEHAVRRGALVDADGAADHFQASLNGLIGEPTGSWVLSDGSLLGERIEGLDASLDFDGEGRYSARARWPHGSLAVEAEFEIEELWLRSRIREAILDLGSELPWSRSWTSGVPVELTSAPVPPPAHAIVAAGAGGLVRLSPNRLTLESTDGAIVLHYVRGDPGDGLGVAFVEVDPPFVELDSLGAALQLDAAAFTAASAELPGTRFSWRSSDPSVVTVDQDGSVVAVATGSATVVVSADGAEASVRVDVVVPDAASAGTESATGTESSTGTESGAGTGSAAETEPGEGNARSDGTTEGCDEDGTTVSVSEERVVQINRSDTPGETVEQRNASTIEQRNGESGGIGCTGSTADGSAEAETSEPPMPADTRVASVASTVPAAPDASDAVGTSRVPDVPAVSEAVADAVDLTADVVADVGTGGAADVAADAVADAGRDDAADVTIDGVADAWRDAGVAEATDATDVPDAANIVSALDLPSCQFGGVTVPCPACSTCMNCPTCVACSMCATCPDCPPD